MTTRIAGAAGEFLVNTTTANNQVFPSISMNASGMFVISWTGYGQDGDPSNFERLCPGIQSQQRRVGRNREQRVGTGIQVNSTTALTVGGNRKWSSVAIDDAGDFVVTWTSYGQDGTGNGAGAGANGQNGIYARHFF